MIGESSFSHFQRLMQSPKTVQVGLIVNKLDLSFNRRRVKYLISELK